MIRKTSEQEDPDSIMCDACGGKLRLLGKKVCHLCHLHFCNSCFTPSTQRSTYTCKICHLQDLEVIERSHLADLSLSDLRYYTKRKCIASPINVSREHIIDIIVARQAKDFADRTKRAMNQVAGIAPNASFEDVDRLVEEPYVSAYSFAGESIPHGGLNVRVSDEAWQFVIAGHGSGGEEVVEMDEEGGRREGGRGEGGRVSVDGLPASNIDSFAVSSDSKTELCEEVDVSLVTTLEALTSVSQIHGLSVKQLKLILQRNCINYKGCVEKEELQVRVRRLWQAREEEKVKVAAFAQAGDVDAESSYMCKICMDAPVDCVLLECGHMLTCVKCGRQLAECPICRQYVTRVVHAFRV